jgi:hypothetical protein
VASEPAPAAPPELAPPPPAEPALPPPAPLPPSPEAVVPLESAPPPAEDGAWYDSINFRAFADAYYSVDFNFPKGRRPDPVRAYDANDGFSLSWVGLDVEKEPEPVGGVIALRFGPTAERLGAGCIGSTCDSSYGLSFVKQGFVSWKPGAAVRLDLGKFDTPYGAEVAEAQYNLNYTRGALYWLGQPAYHTGLRLTADLHRSFALKLLAVNGWNNAVDNNLGKSFGLQGTLRVPAGGGSDDDLLTVSLGYLMGPEADDTALIECAPGSTPDPSEPDGCRSDASNTEGGSLIADRGSSNTEGLRHFVDLTLLATPIPELSLFLNGSLGIENQRSAINLEEFESVLWWGVALAGRYAIDDRAGIGARGEYFSDRDGYVTRNAGTEINLLTGTLTFDYSPAPPVKFMLDGRVDWSNRQIFPKSVRDLTGTSFTATLGAIVTTN